MKFKSIRKMSMAVQIFIAMALSILVGILLQDHEQIAQTFISPLGQIFLNLIKMIVVPVVFCSMICGILSLGDIRKVGSIGGKTFLYYMVTTIFAITIGLGIAAWMNVGAGFNLDLSADLAAYQAPENSVSETLINIFPSNILDALVSANMLQIIVIALFFGFGALMVGEKGKPFTSLVDSINEISLKIMEVIIRLSPIGVFGMLAPVVAVNGPEILLPLLKFILVAYVAFALHAVVTYSATVKMMGKMSPKKFFKGILPAMLFAYSSNSSVATLPITKQCCESLGTKKSITSFVLPLGATINMDGTAIYEGVACIFVAQIFGIDLSVSQLITIILMATIASIGTAGVPGSGVIMLAMIFEAAGLPLEGITLIFGVDRVLDMGRTLVNVTGDASCAVVISEMEKEAEEENETTILPGEIAES